MVNNKCVSDYLSIAKSKANERSHRFNEPITKGFFFLGRTVCTIGKDRLGILTSRILNRKNREKPQRFSYFLRF